MHVMNGLSAIKASDREADQAPHTCTNGHFPFDNVIIHSSGFYMYDACSLIRFSLCIQSYYNKTSSSMY